jgi:hypothetical protein
VVPSPDATRLAVLEFAPLPKTISGKIRRVELRDEHPSHGGRRAERADPVLGHDAHQGAGVDRT